MIFSSREGNGGEPSEKSRSKYERTRTTCNNNYVVGFQCLTILSLMWLACLLMCQLNKSVEVPCRFAEGTGLSPFLVRASIHATELCTIHTPEGNALLSAFTAIFTYFPFRLLAWVKDVWFYCWGWRYDMKQIMYILVVFVCVCEVGEYWNIAVPKSLPKPSDEPTRALKSVIKSHFLNLTHSGPMKR